MEKKNIDPTEVFRSIVEQRQEILIKAERMNTEVLAVGEKELRESMITVYGDVKLDKQEKMFLTLGPEFTVLERLDYAKIKTEFQIALTKVRWLRMGKEPEEIVREIDDKEAAEEEEIEKISFLENRVYAGPTYAQVSGQNPQVSLGRWHPQD